MVLCYDGDEDNMMLPRRVSSFDSMSTCSDGFSHDLLLPHTVIKKRDLQVLEQVGEGGFAVVSRAQLQLPGRLPEIVATKQLKPESFRRDREFIDFIGEMLLMSRLSHPRIVQFKGVLDGGHPCDDDMPAGSTVVVEYMNMGSLRCQLMDVMSGREQPYPRSVGISWMLQVAEGLQYLHGLNATVIHRDLKPENILLTKDDITGEVSVKISDFGLSAVIATHSRSNSIDCQSLDSGRHTGLHGRCSRRGSLKCDLEKIQHQNAERLLRYSSKIGVGGSTNAMRSMSFLFSAFDPGNSTPKDTASKKSEVYHDLSGRTGSLMYMAPEVILNKRYNEKVDVYSFAIILYEVMAQCKLIHLFVNPGTPARIAAERVKQYSESVTNGYRPTIPLHWPLGVRTLIQDCWQHDPRDRPTAQEIVSRLRTALKIQITKEQREEDARAAACACCTIM